MKKQIILAIILFSSFSAFTQVTQEDLEKEIKPLTEKVKTLQSENSKLKSEIGVLNSKLSFAPKGEFCKSQLTQSFFILNIEKK